MGGARYFVLRQGGGQIFLTSLHFTMKSTRVYIITTYNRILHTNAPTQYRFHISVCISQACAASHKWTSGGVLTFQEKDSKFHHGDELH